MPFFEAGGNTIHYGQNNPESDYIMNDKKLESVDEECNLGLNFNLVST